MTETDKPEAPRGDPSADATLAAPTPKTEIGRARESADAAVGPAGSVAPKTRPSPSPGEPPAVEDRARFQPVLPVVRRELYAIDRELARGGMGRISIARDRRMARVVAVKELLPGNRAAAARFEREAILTGQLQHPGIVPIYEAGHWGSGDPFFAMKLVDGRPFHQVISETSCLEERLALLPTVIDVAEALAYAHSCGVIHRDIKPANILLGNFGETVVIDWGLGKELGGDAIEDPEPVSSACDEPALTTAGAAMGTPAYMPPEQAAGEVVDQRADVYAIGAVLYHLLAGAAPYQELEITSAAALLERVREEAPRPLLEVESGAPADLVAVVEKAMARARAERYPSAAELVEELKRFETGQLVGAHDYSFGALLRRWMGRHRAAITVAGVMLLAIAIGGVVSFKRITTERNRAEQQRELARANQAEVEELLDFMLIDMREKLRPVGKLELLETVARRASAYFSDRAIDFDNQVEARRWAIALRNVGDVLVDQGDLDGALDHFRQALKISQRLVDDHPDDHPLRGDLSIGHRSVGEVLEQKRDLDGAEEHFEAARVASEIALAAAPDNPARQRSLSLSFNDLGDIALKRRNPTLARDYYQQALAIRQRLSAEAPDDPTRLRDLGVSHERVGDTFDQTGDLEAATRHYQASNDISARLVELTPEDTRVHRDLAIGLARVGDILYKRGDAAGALEQYRAVVTVRQRLAERDPANVEWQRDLGLGHARVGRALLGLGDLDSALTEHLVWLVTTEKLVARDPTNLTWQTDLAIAHNQTGIILWSQNKPAAAAPHFEARLAVARYLVESSPNDATNQIELAGAAGNLARVWRQRGEAKRARSLFLTCAQTFRQHGTNSDDAYQGTLCAASAGEGELAFELLARAIQLGADAAELESDDELASLRADPRWQPLLESARAGGQNQE